MEKPIALGIQSAILAEGTEAQGLVKFQLKPPGRKGQKLLDHMSFQQQVSFKTKETLYMPNC
jgi:hypothetical protein